MKTYGETKFEDRVSVLSDMTNMVKCVEKLPDLTDESEGWVCQLVTSQPGYVATHVYKCVKRDEVLTWTDITDSTEQYDAELATPKFMKIVDSVAGTLRIIVIWYQPDPDTADEWMYDTLVRKLDAVPERPEDGEIVTCDVDANENRQAIYVSGPLKNYSGNYKYRLFHIYKSGLVTYTELTSAEEPEAADIEIADLAYLANCKVLHKIFKVNDALDIPYTSETYYWRLKITSVATDGGSMMLYGKYGTGGTYLPVSVVSDTDEVVTQNTSKEFRDVATMFQIDRDGSNYPSLTAKIGT